MTSIRSKKALAILKYLATNFRSNLNASELKENEPYTVPLPKTTIMPRTSRRKRASQSSIEYARSKRHRLENANVFTTSNSLDVVSEVESPVNTEISNAFSGLPPLNSGYSSNRSKSNFFLTTHRIHSRLSKTCQKALKQL